MSTAVSLLLGLAGGLVLGAFFFGGLWITVRAVTSAARPRLLLAASFALRFVVLAGGLYLLMLGDWRRLLAALVGLLLARTLLARRVRTPPTVGERA